MYRTILVPLDGSAFAEQALPWALSLARGARATLDLVRGHVLYALTETAACWAPYDPACEAECKREEQLYLDATARWLAAVSPVPMTTAVVSGLEADGILERARATGADLIVMTSHARGPLGRLLLGSVANLVVRRSQAPVLLVRPREPTPTLIPEPVVQNVLVPLDGSTLAEQALGPAADLAGLLGAGCTLLRVEAIDAARREPEARAYLERIAGHLRGLGLPVATQVTLALHVAEAILEHARAQGSDVIALATHGRGGIGRLVLGSVADQVIQGASCSVLVYRPGTEDRKNRLGEV